MNRLSMSARIAILIILLSAVIMRVYRLDHQSFWNDEGNSARLSERSVPLILEGTASDVHPPLYYLALRGWREFVGDSEFALRLLSAYIGVLMVAAGVTLGRVLKLPGVVIAAGLAVAPPLIYYSQEARMYSLLGLLGILFVIGAVTWVNKRTWRSAAMVIIIGACGLYTHYAFPFLLVGINGWVALVLGWRWLITKEERFSTLFAWAGLQIGLLLPFVPWLPFLLDNGGGRDASGDIGPFLAQTAAWLIAGPVEIGSIYLWGYGVLFVTGVIVLVWKKPVAAGLVICWLAGPIGLMGLFGATLPSYSKFLTMVVPAVWLGIAAALSPILDMKRVEVKGVVLCVLGGAILFGSVLIDRQIWLNDRYFRADYRSIAAEITEAQHPNAAVILNAPNQWEVFTYYYTGSAEVLPFPKFVQPDETIREAVDQFVSQYDRIYAIYWGEDGFDPNRITESRFEALTVKAVDEFRGDLRVVMYAVPSDDPAEVIIDQEVLFEGEATIRLDQATLSKSTLAAGDILQVTFNWSTLQEMETRYKVFIHLLNSEGVLVSQRDSEPVGNTRPTSDWAVEEVIVDSHGLLLPIDLPAGEYRVIVGLYDAFRPELRLPADGEDATEIGIIQVR